MCCMFFWISGWVSAAFHPSGSIRTVVFSDGRFFRGRRTQRYTLPSLLLSRSRSQGQLNLEFGTVPQSASSDGLDLQVWVLYSCWKLFSSEMFLVWNVFTSPPHSLLLVRRGQQSAEKQKFGGQSRFSKTWVCVPAHPAGQWWNHDENLSHLNPNLF